MKLNEFKVGDNQVIIEHGKFIFMAVVYTGPGAQALHKVIKLNIQNIEMRYRTALEFWVGDMKQMTGIKKLVEPLLSIKEKEVEKIKGNKANIIPIRVPREPSSTSYDGLNIQSSSTQAGQLSTVQHDRPNDGKEPDQRLQISQPIQTTPNVQTSQVSQHLKPGKKLF